MRLCRLQIARLPGIEPGFTLADFAPGINVVAGPNASGKSSLVRALRAALYREEFRHAGVHVEAAFADGDGGGTLAALRIGDDLHWQHDGTATEAPALPERRFLSCYTLGVEDLLDAAHETDTEIAERLARELAGGYDLREVRDKAPFGLRARHGHNEAGELAAADQALRGAMRTAQQLERDEARLETLRAEKAEAETASREAALHERALDLLDQRRQRRALEQRLQDFPAGMDRLRGDEADTLKELREQLRQREADRGHAADRLAAAETALHESGLAETELEQGALGDHGHALNDLRQVESQLEQKRSALQEAEATLAQAVEALGGEPGQSVQLDPATVREVEEALEKRRDLAAELRYYEHEHGHLPSGDAPDPDPEHVRIARRELFHWLAAPRTPAWTPARIAAAVALFGAGLAGIAAAGALLHWGWLTLVVPLAGGGYVLFLRPSTGDARRREAEARLRESGQAAPADWNHSTVEQHLSALDRAVTEAEQEERGIERRRAVARERDARRKALTEVDEQLRRIAEQVGHDPQILDASLQRWLRLVADWDQARRNTEALRAEHERLHAEAERLRQELLAFLAQYGEAPDLEHPAADVLAERVDRLATRLRQREQALQDIAQARREMQRLNQECEAHRAKIRALFERVGLAADDDDALRQRMERLEDWQALTRKLSDTRGLEADREQQLGNRADLLQQVDDDNEDGLHERLATLREQAASLEERIQEITRIEGALERAGHDRALEAARTRHQQARESLSDRLDEALYAEAGRFLLEQVEAEHEQAVQPAALRQARDWFRRFTHYQYELVFAADGDTRFAARETTTGAHRRLSELSSGTRMQLLLAVRIAFALSAERGTTRLPLILDEALTTADPERFRAVAESLALLAREDQRQVFYLTAQPDDARYWAEHDPHVHVIDLAERRGLESAITVPEALTPAERPAVPSPEGQSPEAYAVALGVAPIDPWRDPAGIHAFFLLRDDLAKLRRLLAAGVRTLGQIETLLAADAVDTLLDADEQTRLRARSEGTKAWLHAWRQGRGRPVDRAALEASGAVSATFIERVADLNERLGGDGSALIERLAAGDVARFQSDKREELRAWLLDHGYISSETPLSTLELELRVAAAMRPWVADEGGVTAQAQELVRGLEVGLRGT